METREKFADRLRKLRLAKKASQRDLANLLGITVSAISSYEKAQKEPNLSNIIKLAEYFNVTVDFLLCRDVEVQTLTNKEIPEELRALGIDEIKINQLSSNELQQELTDLSNYAEKIKKILKDLGK